MQVLDEASQHISPGLLPNQIVISVDALRKSYGHVTAADGVTFEVVRGEVFGLLGPNGAGKTTTLEMIEGMLPIDSGRAVVAGIDVGREPHRVRRIIGIQLQQASYFERLTPCELLVLFGDLYGRRVDPMPLLREVRLDAHAGRHVKQLSGGQQQRFCVALALVNDPVVLFLDEPTTGLDPQARRTVWDLVRRLQTGGLSIVLTTHYMEEAEVLCDRVAIMNEGRIVALDSPAVLIQQLLDTGFSRPVAPRLADLEDVFLHHTGRQLKEE